jgi:hypothetical protein
VHNNEGKIPEDKDAKEWWLIMRLNDSFKLFPDTYIHWLLGRGQNIRTNDIYYENGNMEIDSFTEERISIKHILDKNNVGKLFDFPIIWMEYLLYQKKTGFTIVSKFSMN